jgi:hypothetical protein
MPGGLASSPAPADIPVGKSVGAIEEGEWRIAVINNSKPCCEDGGGFTLDASFYLLGWSAESNI